MSRLEATIKAIFSISEICIEESKSHISSENAIKAIRGLLGQTQSYTELKKLADELQYYRSLDKQGRLIEQKHGRWKIISMRPVGTHLTHYCSICGGHGNNEMDYCPNCGAKMDEE